MTTSTTLGCIVMTPLICQVVLGAVVPVNAIGIMYSTLQVVLAPIFLGVGVNTLMPKFAKAVTPFTPVVGVISTLILVGSAVAKVAPYILSSGIPLQLACLNLHLVGGLLGYGATALAKFDEKTCRTVAIETAMKSSAFGFLLASSTSASSRSECRQQSVSCGWQSPDPLWLSTGSSSTPLTRRRKASYGIRPCGRLALWPRRIGWGSCHHLYTLKRGG